MPILIDLDDERARDPGIVGAKAAVLARARAAGLPALPGVVVPADRSRSAVAVAAAALTDGDSGAARLAAMEVAVAPEIVAELSAAVRRLGEPVVVRSSSLLESNGVWAGAFSSFEGIGLDDLRTAVRGVWASAFTIDALARSVRAGVSLDSLELAVLVQRQLEPLCGGSARVDGTGDVTVDATKGSPRDLLAGWEAGIRTSVDSEGNLHVPEAGLAFGDEPLWAAADLVRRTRDALGDDLIEWAWTGEGIVLLQSGALPAPLARADGALDDELHDPIALRVARLAQRFPGALGAALVLPWACALPDTSWVPSGIGVASTDPVGDLAAAVAVAGELAEEAWQERPDRAQAEAAATFTALRGAEPAPALSRLAGLRPVDPVRGAMVVKKVEEVAAALVRRQQLREPRRLWHHTVDAVFSAAQDGGDLAAGVRASPDRWEPFVYGSVRAHGQSASGMPVVEGLATGRALVVHDPHAPPALHDRDVVVATLPLPALAPTLWRASALLTTAGNPAAHLMEVAASLGVPTLVGVDLSPVGGLGAVADRSLLAAVDSRQGLAWFVEG